MPFTQEDGGGVGLHLQFHSETMVQACCTFSHLGVAQREPALPPQTYLLVGLVLSVGCRLTLNFWSFCLHLLSAKLQVVTTTQFCAVLG